MTARLGALLTLSVLLAGCGQVVTVREAQLEEDITAQLERTTGNAPDTVDCPGDLEAEDGNEIRCTMTRGEKQREVTVTVTGVSGNTVDFDIEVEE
ncbi:hypothetical protein GCM10009623_21310 [Nocardioides aestuarii]|uniref:DUF4333 domain-containing protein n=1 Tax=Nocardioides aestuarii TaxID=252231 RepID=A0ABW4TL11_9ACTN